MVMLFAILAMAMADRMRGGGWFKHSHGVGMLAMGLITAWLIDAHGLAAAYTVAAVMFGASFGWGNPISAALNDKQIGADHEWWQVGVMRRSVFAALLFRGAMWGAPLVLLEPAAAAAFTVGFTAAPYLTRLLDPPAQRIDRWAFMEYTRGAAIAALLLLFSRIF